ALYASYGQIPLTQALFLGVKACVVIIVIEALLRVARRGLKTRAAWVIAGLSFGAIFALGLPFPLIILAAAIYGALTASGENPKPVPNANPLPTILTWTAIWWTPVAIAYAAKATLLTEIGLYFSRLAVVTFGGAYSVLAYMTQSVVTDKGWLTTTAMIDGLGLAETTPGPLILVTEFVGYQAGAAIGPGTALLAAAMTLWVTFTPCFLWIFAGAPYIAQLTTRPRPKAALQAISAAVVGVILSLSLWFALHVFFTELGEIHIFRARIPLPDPTSLNWRALVIALAAAYALLIRHMNLITVLILAAVAGSLLAQL
ncbi:MAG: chromate transporter, partial [Deltaproteobacteria bacterium]